MNEVIFEVVEAFDENFDAVVEECPQPFKFIDGIPKEDTADILSALKEAYNDEFFEFTMHKDLQQPGCYSIAATYMPSFRWMT